MFKAELRAQIGNFNTRISQGDVILIRQRQLFDRLVRNGFNAGDVAENIIKLETNRSFCISERNKLQHALDQLNLSEKSLLEPIFEDKLVH